MRTRVGDCGVQEQGQRGQVWAHLLRQVCAAENAPQRRNPWKRPGHFTTNLCFNPLLETMQTLIQKNTSAIRIVSIQFPGFLLTAAIPQVGPAGLASPASSCSSPVRLEGKWNGSFSCLLLFKISDLIPHCPYELWTSQPSLDIRA